MNGVIKYFKPLGVFVMGMFLSLGVLLFFPAINTAAQALSSNPGVSSGVYWNLQGTITSVRLIIFVFCMAITLFMTAVVWLKQK